MRPIKAHPFTSIIAAALVTAGCSVTPDGDDENLGTTSAALGEWGPIYGIGTQCVDVQGSPHAPVAGTAVVMNPCTRSGSQNWVLTSTHEIRLYNNGAPGFADKCLDVPGGSTTPGIGLWIQTCNGGNAQKWFVAQDGTIRSALNGNMCLNVANGSTAPNTRLQLNTCVANYGAQKLHFEGFRDYLWSGESLPTGQGIRSANGRYRLIMQHDCNLVLYDVTTAIWASNTMGRGYGCFAAMQTDGNFVVYSASGAAVWATGTQGHPGAHVVLQNDNNLVVYDHTCNTCGMCGTFPFWASRTGKVYPWELWCGNDHGNTASCGAFYGYDKVCSSPPSGCSGGWNCFPNGGGGFSCGPC